MILPRFVPTESNSNAWSAPEPEAMWPSGSPGFGKITSGILFSSRPERMAYEFFLQPHMKSLRLTSIILLQKHLDRSPPCTILQLSRTILQLSSPTASRSSARIESDEDDVAGCVRDHGSPLTRRLQPPSIGPFP